MYIIVISRQCLSAVADDCKLYRNNESEADLKGKDHKATTEFCLKEFGKLNILMQISLK